MFNVTTKQIYMVDMSHFLIIDPLYTLVIARSVSDEAISNIDILLNLLKTRLRSLSRWRLPRHL